MTAVPVSHRRPSGPRRRIVGVAAAAAVVIIVDQLSKTWAEHRLAGHPIHVLWTLRLQLVFNPGIAFSLGRGSTGLVTVIATAILAALALFTWHSSGRLLGVGLGLIMGGAAGNLIDRLARHHNGQVIDFIDVRWWPVFNVADAALTCGVILALVASVLSGSHPPAGAEPASAA